MALSDAIEKLGRTHFRGALHGPQSVEQAPELDEIRLAVIDAVKAKSHRAGRARVFQLRLIRIHLRGIPAEQASAFESGFLAEFLAQDLRRASRDRASASPADFQVELRTAPQLPAQGEEFVWIETGLDGAAVPLAPEARLRAGRRG